MSSNKSASQELTKEIFVQQARTLFVEKVFMMFLFGASLSLLAARMVHFITISKIRWIYLMQL